MAMDAQQLFDTMKKIQEPKGYYFNKNLERTFELLEALLVKRSATDIWGVPAGCYQATGKRTRTFSVPAFTARGTNNFPEKALVQHKQGEVVL